MKKLLTLAFVCLAYATSFGQNVPQGIAYQAVAVKDGAYSVAGQNPQAIYWSNKEIKVRFTIFDTYPNGSSQYSEVHTTSTDEYGVFNLIIGQGSGLSGDFTTIPWELGDAHLQVEIDFENKNTFTLTALEKFWSVPYAFVTNETGTSNTDSALAALNNKFQYLKDRDKDTVIGNEGISYQALDSLNKALKAEIAALRFSDKDTVIGNELQTLSVTGDSVTISDGNTVVINHPANLDNVPANEIQTISLVNDTIRLNNGGGVIPMTAIKSDLDNLNGNRSSSFAIKGIYNDLGTTVPGTSYKCCSSCPLKPAGVNTRYLDTFTLKAGDLLQIKKMVVTNPDGYAFPSSAYCGRSTTRVYLLDSAGNKLQGTITQTQYNSSDSESIGNDVFRKATEWGNSGMYDQIFDAIYEIPNDGVYILGSTSVFTYSRTRRGVGPKSAYIFIN